MVEENHLAPTPANCTDPHSPRRTRFTLVHRKAILPPAMVLGTYTAKSTRLRGSNKLYLPYPRLPYTNSSGHASYSNAVKNGHNTYNIPRAPQQQQNVPPQHYNVQTFSPSHLGLFQTSCYCRAKLARL